jgi:hypothetical protein
MLLNHLFEDAESDVRRSLNADRLYQNATAHLYRLIKAGEKLPTAIFGGKDVPCLPAQDYNAPAFFHDVIMLFPNNEYAMGGKAVQMKEKLGGRYRFLVIINVDGDTTDEIWKALRYDRVETVVRHELQHIIDFKRRKGDIFKTREPNFKDNAGSMSPEERRAYHNSSAETNAYFHNLAEPLLARIRLMQKSGVEMAGLFPDLSRDFREYLTKNLANKHGVLKQHWEAISEENRRKVFARLSKLFSLYWQMVDAHEAEKAKYSQSEEVAA